MTNIIGIDPGLNKTGWGIVSHKSNKLQFIAAGTIAVANDLAMSERLYMLASKLEAILSTYDLSIAAIEETFVNKNPLSSLKLGHARGCIMLTLAKKQLPVYEYATRLVKKNIVGVGMAEKKQVFDMIKFLLPSANVDSFDASDALAVAVCHIHHGLKHRLWNINGEFK